jgi:hypothetical protein
MKTLLVCIQKQLQKSWDIEDLYYAKPIVLLAHTALR